MELGRVAVVAAKAGATCHFGRTGLIGKRSIAYQRVNKCPAGRCNNLALRRIRQLSTQYGSFALGDQVEDGVRERTLAQRDRLAAAAARSKARIGDQDVASMQAHGEDVAAAAEVMQWSRSELLRIRLSCFLPLAALVLHQTQTLSPHSPPAGLLTGRPAGQGLWQPAVKFKVDVGCLRSPCGRKQF